MVSRFVLRPAPVGDPGTLMSIHTTHQGECCNAFSWPLFADLRAQTKSFSGVTGVYELLPASIGGTGRAGTRLGPGHHPQLLRCRATGHDAGPRIHDAEERLPVIVIGHGLWQRRFGADPAIAGKHITLSGRPFTVVGVAPPGFRGLDIILDCQFWVPLGNLDQLLPNAGNYQSRDYHWIQRCRTPAARRHASAGRRRTRSHRPESGPSLPRNRQGWRLPF